MTNRREFIHYSGAAAMSASLPLSVLAEEQRRLPTRPIPGTDEALPIIGLGNSSAFRADDLSAASKLIDIFLDHGGRYIDAGGSSRMSVGKLGIEKGASDSLFFGNYLDPGEVEAMHQEALIVARAQGKSALDLVHTRKLSDFRAQHDRYKALKEDGLVRFVGIARSGRQNFDAIEKLVVDGMVDFIQVNYSLVEPEAADRLLPLAMDKGVAVNINRPFINGNYFSLVRGHELPKWASDFDCHSWAQFSLKFILAHPAVNCVLTETTDPEHAVENLGAGFGRLPDERQQQLMRDVMQGIRS